MRNTLLDAYEDTPRDVVAIGNEYRPHEVRPAHRHRRGQLLYATTGVLTVTTPQGSWVVPPERAIWIPPGVPHEVRMGGHVSIRNAFVLAQAAAAAGLPEHCRVIAVSPLLRELLITAVDLPPHYDLHGRDGRIMALILDEIRTLPTLALNTPLPRTARLAQLCRALLEAPTLTLSVDAAAAKAGMSRRHFTRQFRAETGMSFAGWRQQACLQVALARLGAGEPVTRVALDLGYASPSAFSAVFRRVLGVPPSRYFGAA
ncbi:MAG TPA: helix-turn-helix transcriptional regulator [Mizugakiibacter sp.]